MADLKDTMFKDWLKNQDKRLGETRLKIDFDLYFMKLKETGENEEIEEILNNEEMYFKEPNELIEYFNNLE
jgi:hypothetical protein